MNIFIAFANQDRDVRDKLLRQMNLVKDRQGWNIWSSKEIKAGERWDDEIKQRLMDSEVIVLLLSTDFFNSKYIVETELPKVVEKHRLGDCQIIPVIARVCHWKETAFGEYAELGEIQALPVGEKPIVSRGHWDNDDQPYFEVVEGMKGALKDWGREKQAALVTHNQQREQEAALRLATLATQQREREDQAAFDNAKTPRALHEYLKQGFTMYASKAKETLDSITSRPLVVVRSDRDERNGCALWVLLLLVATMIWLLFDKNSNKESQLPQSPQPSRSSTNAPALKSDFEMATVQGGTFQMGSHRDETGRESDECQYQITVNAFSIGKYEVTQAEWQAIMGYNPSKIKSCEQCPVDSVSWEDAQEFLQKLNAKYPGKNYRLPTEAEWEYAARGGQKSNRYRYSGAKDINTVAWCLENSDDQTHIVGQKARNELGLYDMTGNVWELCQGFYNAYPNCKAIGVEGAYPIIRGGSWGDAALLCRNANRSSCEKSDHNPCVGFRLASDF